MSIESRADLSARILNALEERAMNSMAGAPAVRSIVSVETTGPAEVPTPRENRASPDFRLLALLASEARARRTEFTPITPTNVLNLPVGPRRSKA